MSIKILSRPQPSEYNAFYETYVGVVPEGDVLQTLDSQAETMAGLIQGPLAGLGDLRYADGKWTVKEVLGHVNDTERVFSYRAMTIARGDSQELPGMDQDLFTSGANFAARELESLLEEYRAVRAATLALFRSLDFESAGRVGNASGFPITVRALVHIVAGHERHHQGVLRERYLATDS